MDSKELLNHINGARNGSIKDFEIIYNYSLPSLKSISSKFFIPGGDREDLIQEGALGIMTAIMDYDIDKGASFKTFMEMVVERRIINAIERAGRKKHSILNSAVSLSQYTNNNNEPIGTVLDVLTNEGLDPEEIINQAESINEYTDMISEELTSLERKILIEFLEGGTYRQIGEKMGKDAKSIDNALQRVRRKLDKAIELNRKRSTLK